MDNNSKELTVPAKKMRYRLICTLIGYLILLLGARPSIFGLDRSPVIGFAQTATFLVGLALICLGGYLCLIAFWIRDMISLTADFGIRLILTGLVISIFSGMADVFGFGSHPLSGIPFFGPLQSTGVEIGMGIIGIGFVMMIAPNQKTMDHSKDEDSGKIDMFQDN